MGNTCLERNDIYTETIGRCMSPDTFICKVPWQGLERIFACRRHMRYTRGFALKDGQFGNMAELQIDTMALRRGMLLEENAGINCEKGAKEHNIQLIRRMDERWELSRTCEADPRKNL